VNPAIDTESIIYVCKYLADVPGYVYTEEERRSFQDKLRGHLKGKPVDTGKLLILILSVKKIHSTYMLSRRSSRDILNIPPKHSDFTKIFSYVYVTGSKPLKPERGAAPTQVFIIFLIRLYNKF
jgi:hypothetical protein